jgi:FkbM family methyltransferase
MGELEWAGGVFHHEDSITSRFVSNDILQGLTYPCVPFASEVRVVVDVGANIGAASCFFARLYPHAVVHALEPSPEPFALCTRNVADFPNVRAEQIALHAYDGTADLYPVTEDSITASLYPPAEPVGDPISVSVRAAGSWARERSVERLDILKIDTEGGEVAILESFGQLIDTVRVLYVEYHSDDDRRIIDQMIAASHVIGFGAMTATSGEITYLNRSIMPTQSEMEAWVRRLFIEHRPSGSVSEEPALSP